MNFYNEFNKYITLKDREVLKQKYYPYRKKIKEYKKLDKYIDQRNNEYISSLRKELPILDNINGYPLDEYQSRVVLSNEEATLVVAGAGSGKSLTIIGKIVYLIKCCNIKPEEILCISFTNDATINLKKNIEKNYDFKIDIYTFHKLALHILKQENKKYIIAPDNYLDDVVDDFFHNLNEIHTKALHKVLGKKYTEKDLNNLKRLVKTFISLYKSNNYDITYFKTMLKKIRYTIHLKEYIHNKYLILLIFNIYILYEQSLKEENALDFNDMINKSITSLQEKGLKDKWKYIIIDEYQDTSEVKFNMIQEIMHITKSKLLAVGDDFQSIYRFTGCDLKIFLNFTKYFNNSIVLNIINTYRNPQELINVAGKFIMKNKYQYKKNLISSKHAYKPIKIVYSDNKIKVLKYLLKKLKDKDIMVLGRNNKDIYKYIDHTFTELEDNYFTYNDIKFKYLTAHRSKGLECHNVILINIEDSFTGFPTKLKDEKILKYVNNTKDYYPYEEERRLFYVALTRTKNNTYIISSYKHESIFTKEIKENKEYVEIIKK